jgi:phosphatidylinositol alpha-1,6-mannosyltransferase
LGEDGSRVAVLTQSSAGPGVRRDGRAVVVDLGRSGQALLLVKFLLTWLKLRGRLQADCIHATTWRLALPALLGGRGGAPLAITVHGREIFVVPRVLRPVMRWALSRADGIAVVSSAIRNAAAAAGIAASRWRVVWNGASYVDGRGHVDRGPAREGDDRPVRIFTLCRLVARKNLVAAVRALGRVKASSPVPFEYWIGGDGPEAPKIAAVISQLGLDDRISLMGRVDDGELPRLYRESDIFLHPQIDLDGDVEGFGLVIADAMSFGAAVVAGRDGGPGDFIRDGETGLLVDGRDEQAIADALTALLNDPALGRRLGDAGSKWVHAELSWRRAAQQVLAILDRA